MHGKAVMIYRRKRLMIYKGLQLLMILSLRDSYISR